MIAQCVAFVAVVIAVAAPVCGHQGADWPLTGTWRRVRAAWGRARGCAGAGATQGPLPVPDATDTVTDALSARTAPRWARPT